VAVSIKSYSNARLVNQHQEESDYIKRIYFILFIIALIGCLPVSTALSGSCQPYNVTVTSKYISSTSVCSCGSGEYAYEKHTFLNYCPACHHYGTLSYSKACWGGQWTCSHCDADYCCQCGKEKISGTELWLTPYTMKPVISRNNTTNTTENVTKEEHPISKEQALINLIQSKLDLNMLF